MQVYLAEFPLRILSLEKLGPIKTYPETGTTFSSNARGKSLYYSRHWEGLTLGEDSGLEIAYLEGAPGVYSARFAGHRATDEKNITKVLDMMRQAPPHQRQARFISCMALAHQGRILTEISAGVEGSITQQRMGAFGFGYDPIFYFPPLAKTFAELPPEEKNKISHRGQALAELKEYLRKSGFGIDNSDNSG